MKKITRGLVAKYAFDNRDEPCLKVTQGETFQVETDDALSGMIADDSDNPKIEGFESQHFLRLAQATPGLFNPVVGPIYVEGCEAGDVLAVTIDWIDPWRYGFSGVLPKMGPLGDSLKYKDCTENQSMPACKFVDGFSDTFLSVHGEKSDAMKDMLIQECNFDPPLYASYMAEIDDELEEKFAKNTATKVETQATVNNQVSGDTQPPVYLCNIL